MTIFEMILITATFSCSLVAGFLLSFAIVVMPGLRNLDNEGFVRGFGAIDLVIQNRQPLFVLVWVGSLVSLCVAGWMGLDRLDGPGRLLLAGTALVNLLGVHLPTAAVNVRLNNHLQSLQIDHLDAAELRSERRGFESRWNRWNAFRTSVAGLVSLALIVTLLIALVPASARAQSASGGFGDLLRTSGLAAPPTGPHNDNRTSSFSDRDTDFV